MTTTHIVKYTKVADTLILFVESDNGQKDLLTIEPTHACHRQLNELIATKAYAGVNVADLLDPAVALARATKTVMVDSSTVVCSPDGAITVDGEPLQGFIATFIRTCISQGKPIDALIRFHQRLSRNSVPAIRDQLFTFLNSGKFALTENGKFIAYKGVYRTADPSVFASAHDQNFFYELGVKTYENVKPCDYDVNVACGKGLHVGTFEYARSYGNTIVEVIVDPAEVICVPKDSGGQKLRAKALLTTRIGTEPQQGLSNVVDPVAETEVEVDQAQPSLPDAFVTADFSHLEATVAAMQSLRTYYHQKTGKKCRAAKRPGPEWSSHKPKIVRLADANAAGKRTYYNAETGERVRTVQHPGPGWTSHKPKT